MGAPGVFAIEQHIAPGFLEVGGRERAWVADGPQRLGLHDALGGSAVQRRLRRRRCRAVFPVGRVVAAEHRQLVAVAPLELAERRGGRADDQPRRDVAGVPVAHDSGDLLVG